MLIKQILYVLGYTLITIFIGIVIGSLLCSGGKQDIAVNIEPGDIAINFDSDSTEILENILDKKDYPREFTISTPDGDIQIDSTTLYGDIPPIETRWQGKQDFLINGKFIQGAYNGLIVHTGDIHRLELQFDPITTKIEIPKPAPFHLYIEIHNRLDQNINWHGALAVNLWYKNFALDGILAADPIKREDETEYKINFLAGFSYRIKIF